MAGNFGSAWAEEFSGSPVWTLGQLAVAIGLGLKATYEWAKDKATPNDVFVWMLVLMVYVVGVFVFHAWRAWDKVYKGKAEVDRKLKEIEDATPQIEFHVANHSPLTLGHGVGAHIDVWELWFRNRPSRQVVAATAKNLTAEISFCDDQWVRSLDPFVGQWAVTRMPHHVGWDSLEPMIDLQAIHTWGKLLVAGTTSIISTRMEKNTDGKEELMATERDVYALSGENLHHDPQWAAHQQYLLRRSAVRLRVTLAAENMPEQVFHFVIKRDDLGAIEAIDHIDAVMP
jgi:hypothetical protein